MSKHRTHVGVTSRALRKRMSKGPGRGDTSCVKVEKDAYGFPVKPIHRSNLVRIEVSIQQRQRVPIEPQASVGRTRRKFGRLQPIVATPPPPHSGLSPPSTRCADLHNLDEIAHSSDR